MASGTARTPPVPPSPPPSAQSAARQRYIRQQLSRTRFQLKLVDLFGGLMLLASGVLSLLLLVAVVDGWLLDLGVVGRLLVLLVLAGSALLYGAVYVAPLLFRRINPLYAARVIEDSQPSLKNSLINFLTFRSNRSAAHEVVYEALQEQAATDLSQVPIESTVDRSKLIRAGYLLVAVMVVCALYKVLSPKDPFQTFARVLTPFAKISRPSRVQITAVEPGDAEVFHGQQLRVSARIEGADREDLPALLYSTADGQTVDGRIEMAPADNGVDYECFLSPGESGIQQELRYRIVAGDAASQRFHVRVIAVPAIVVQRVEYDYPDYTGRPNYTVERQGDLRALEGTRVTLHCRANHPIKAAYIQLSPAEKGNGSGAARSPSGGVFSRSVPMQSHDVEASGALRLQLQADRRTPLDARYSVRFITPDGYRNPEPIIHQIEVIPDLAPEVEILWPSREVIEVPENGQLRIEVRAIDPDYGLSKIALRAVSGGSPLIDQTLLDKPAGRPGQAIVHYEFKPRALKLGAGTEVQYWAVAEDNRTSPISGRPEPNTTRTPPHYIIRVVESEKVLAEAHDETKSSENGREDEQPTQSETQPRGAGGSAATDRGNSEPSPDGAAKTDTRSRGEGSTGAPASGAGSLPGGSSKPVPAGDRGEESQGRAKESAGEEGSQRGEGTSGSGRSAGRSADGRSAAETPSETGARQESPPGNGSSQPLHPGEVFEKVLQHTAQQRKGAAGQSASGKPADQRGSESPPSSGQPGERQAGPTGNREGQAAPGQQAPGDQQAASRGDGRHGAGGQQSGGGGGKQMKGQAGGNSAGQPDEGQQRGRAPRGEAGSAGQNNHSGRDAEAGTDSSNQTHSGSSAGRQPTGSQPGASSGQTPGAQQQGGRTGNQQASGSQPSGSKTSGTAADRQAGGAPQGSQPPPGQSGGRKPRPGGQKAGGQPKPGQSGGSQQSAGKGGSPQAQGQNRDRGKRRQGEGGGQRQAERPKSPSISGAKGSAQGQNEGDRSGRAGSGGGQSASQPGTDRGGSTSSAPQAAGTADDSAAGTATGGAGDRQPAGKRTGSSGSEPGVGTRTAPSPSGSNPQSQPGIEPSRKGASPFGGGGGIANTPNAPTDLDGEIPPGEKANLQYARQATDLVLQYLKDQQNHPDPELLDELHWTKDDLRKFVERWETLKRNAKKDPKRGRRALVESLRSLGLRPSRDRRRAGGAVQDSFKSYEDAGQATRPPTKYLEKFNAFLKGTARVQHDK